MRITGFVLADEDVSAPGPVVETGVGVAGYSGGFAACAAPFPRSCLLLREILGGELGELVLGPLAFAQAEADGVFADGFFE